MIYRLVLLAVLAGLAASAYSGDIRFGKGSGKGATMAAGGSGQEGSAHQLIEAIRMGDPEQTLELIQRSDGVRRGQAMHLAAQYGQVRILEALFAQGESLEVLYQGRTVLMTAVYHKQAEASRYLIQRGAALSPRDWNGRTALGYARNSEDQALVQMLLEVGAPE